MIDPTTQGNEDHQAVLNVRRFRQWYGNKRLSQGALAELAGVSPRQVRRYESATALLPPIVSLLRLAIALEVSVEALVSRDVLDELRADIEARRIERGLARPEDDLSGDGDAF